MIPRVPDRNLREKCGSKTLRPLRTGKILLMNLRIKIKNWLRNESCSDPIFNFHQLVGTNKMALARELGAVLGKKKAQIGIYAYFSDKNDR